MNKDIISTLKKLTVSEEELRDLIVNQRATDVEIAKRLGVCAVTVMHWRQKLGIERPPVEKQQREQKVYAPKRKPRLSEEILRDLYLTRKLPQRVIGEQLGVSQCTIGNWLEKYGIDPIASGGRLAVQLDETELRDLYHEKEWTMEKIAKHFKCGESTVRQNLIRFGLMIDTKEVLRRRLANNKDVWPGRSSTARGYAYIMDHEHPDADSSGYVAEHRLNAEKAIGRRLLVSEQVHHINLQKQDNGIENLAVLPGRQAHALVHKYMERTGAFLLGLTDVRPDPLVFSSPVFWGGEWLTSVDLIERSALRAVNAIGKLTQSIRDNGLKYEIEEAA